MDALADVPQRLDRFESQFLQFREEVRAEFSAVRDEVRTESSAVRAEIRAGDEATRVQMRALHEDVISRLTLIQEGQAAGAGRAASGRRKR